MAEEYDYPEDEFDRLARDYKALGAHRQARSNRSWWLALIAIIVIVPLLAWIFVRIGAIDSIKDKGATPRASVSATGTPSKTPTPTAQPSDDTDETDADDNETANAPSVDMSAQVSVLNGSGITGLAATKAEILNGEGFANTVPDNYIGGAEPAESTVYYANESDSATAEKVASSLGISHVELSPDYVAGGQGIVVVLRSDVA